MKRLLPCVLLCALPLNTMVAPPASAQWTVYDPANHVQNILQAIQAVEEVTNQIEQLAHEIEMLENMARDLETLPVNVAEAIILDRIRRIEELMREAEGIGYGVEEVEREYEEVYPETYGEEPPRQEVLVEDARQRWRQSRTAYRDTLVTVSAALEDNETDADAIAGLIETSQNAVGNLQAVQAGNQIEAIQTEQLIQMESMMASYYRAEALERARELAEAERGRARTKSFLEN
ncbi:MAG: P-type conjugative transfer protein TrbJ [Hirschia sp.]|mgnify:CR=1 FL=1|jgi:P-type conjugative transfer protein TrbJ|nr:P-type conjugative transfer protein TrbJ [Hirschia sp.]MBF20274.1 P-type conjugative transfer protein TrbJ [Hirschia sp.]|tara:strand:+ start:492 stop:1193 length:702 start_codon:yes stop_codon:yes gene_type:complete